MNDTSLSTNNKPQTKNYHLPYQLYRFTIEAQDELILPYYKGSTVRGGFGIAFRRIVCALRKKECGECMLRPQCIYAYIFETAPHDGTEIMGMGKYTKIPHPFIIEPPADEQRLYVPGEMIIFHLILIGKANEYLPYFIFTFDELGAIGIGKKRGKYILRTVETMSHTAVEDTKTGDLVYSSQDKTVRPVAPEIISIPCSFDFRDGEEESVMLRFLTPARISYQRKLTANLKFDILIRNILRRFNLLYYFHGGRQPADLDYRQIINEAEKVKVSVNGLRWRDWERYSSRQQTRMKMGGLVGEIVFKGNIGPFLSILQAGEIFHIGKGTSFGLGKYKIVSR